MFKYNMWRRKLVVGIVVKVILVFTVAYIRFFHNDAVQNQQVNLFASSTAQPSTTSPSTTSSRRSHISTSVAWNHFSGQSAGLASNVSFSYPPNWTTDGVNARDSQATVSFFEADRTSPLWSDWDVAGVPHPALLGRVAYLRVSSSHAGGNGGEDANAAQL